MRNRVTRWSPARARRPAGRRSGRPGPGTITTPKEHLGFDAGDDYMLANYTQLQAYFAQAGPGQSQRFRVVNIGTTAEGRPMIMAIITSPENHKQLDRYKEISQRLARAEGLTDDAGAGAGGRGQGGRLDRRRPARDRVRPGAAPLPDRLPDGEPHRPRDDAHPERRDPAARRRSTRTAWSSCRTGTCATRTRSSGRWTSSRGSTRSTSGHDNNRDSYANNQPETEAISRQQFIEWNPQIMYNQHQTGPAGTVLFMAPFRDPFNYNYDPLVPQGIELVGAAIHSRFIAEGKPGAVQRGAASYSTWFNGGVRTTTGFHNQIGLLTEIIGNPTPISIPLPAAAAAARRQPAVPDPAAAGVAPAAVDRVPAHGRSRDPRPRLEDARGLPVPHRTGWARTRSSAGARTPGRSRRRGSRPCRRRLRRRPAGRAEPRPGAAAVRRRRRAAAVAAAERPSKYYAMLRDPAPARSARLHHPVGPAGLPDGDASSSTR